MNKDGAQEYIAELEAKRQKRYMDVYNKAFDVATDNVVECMEELANIALRGENERVRRDACRDIAYIAGLKPKEALSAGRTPKLIIEEKTEPKKGTWSA